MESIHDEDSTNSSSEEVDQAEKDNNDVGTGRSYECVFCKRGFNSAQALGGHMNIHRKDRAKNNRPALIHSHKHEEIYSSPRIYQEISRYPPNYSAAQEAQFNYRTYIPASTSAATPSYAHHSNGFCDQNPHRFNPFGDDWRMSLSLPFGPPHAEDQEKKREVESEEDELDLELRLGHNP